MFTVTATGPAWSRLSGQNPKAGAKGSVCGCRAFMTGTLHRIQQETFDSQVFKQAGNGVTVNVIEAIGTLPQADAASPQKMKTQRGKAVWQLEFRINISVQRLR